MGPYARFASGLLVGLILFLAMAMMGVIAVNGANNPGLGPAQSFSAAAGGTADRPAVGADSSTLKALDLNGDGRVSLAEAAGYAEVVTRFDRADRNKDGRLTQAEFDRLAKLPERKAPKKKSPRRQPATKASS